VRVLVVGGGGREHALVWRIARSPRVEALLAAPGNPGIARHARCVPVEATDDAGLAALAARERIDLVVVGPEVPLVQGVAERLRARGLAVFGPDARAAALEGSKAFAKRLMARQGVPTARFRTFDDPGAARAYCREIGPPLVVKADGLAAGKGVVVCRTPGEAAEAVTAAMERGAFGRAGATVVVEEFLDGDELSFFAVANGKDAVALDAAQDHKTVLDGDRGPNTGGMGTYAPVPGVDAATVEAVMARIVTPTLAGLAAEGAEYRGVLYAGLIRTREGIKVIEFNCRFGDPECQVLMARAGGDVVPLLAAAARGESLPPVPAPAGAAVCVVLASGGYPGTYPTGLPIEGVEAAEAVEGVQVFHAGTALREGALVTAGGRVLGVTAAAPDLPRARDAAYAAAARIRFEGMHYRKDIAGRALGARREGEGR
jgi:phosphoribosylamine--glycine ligase